MALSFCWVILTYLVSIRVARDEANQMQAPPASDIIYYSAKGEFVNALVRATRKTRLAACLFCLQP